MTDDATPAKAGLTDGLGKLPEARWKWKGGDSRPYEDSYSASQMREYALQERAAERERCAVTWERLAKSAIPGERIDDTLRRYADAIRCPDAR